MAISCNEYTLTYLIIPAIDYYLMFIADNLHSYSGEGASFLRYIIASYIQDIDVKRVIHTFLPLTRKPAIYTILLSFKTENVHASSFCPALGHRRAKISAWREKYDAPNSDS